MSGDLPAPPALAISTSLPFSDVSGLVSSSSSNQLSSSSRTIFAELSGDAVSSPTAAADAKVIDLLTYCMIPACPPLPLLHHRMYSVLLDGASKIQSEWFMRACYKALFTLISGQIPASETPTESASAIARSLIPQVMAHCRTVLQQFVADDKLAGSLPLPQGRIAQVCCILSNLKDLRIDPTIMTASPRTQQPLGVESTPVVPLTRRQALMDLYPLLCECITARESAIKVPLKELFLQLGSDMS